MVDFPTSQGLVCLLLNPAILHTFFCALHRTWRRGYPIKLLSTKQFQIQQLLLTLQVQFRCVSILTTRRVSILNIAFVLFDSIAVCIQTLHSNLRKMLAGAEQRVRNSKNGSLYCSKWKFCARTNGSIENNFWKERSLQYSKICIVLLVPLIDWLVYIYACSAEVTGFISSVVGINLINVLTYLSSYN